MSQELTWPAVMAWRVQRQGLAARVEADGWPEIVRGICGLHAQVASSAELTLWARVEDLPAATRNRPVDRQGASEDVGDARAMRGISTSARPRANGS